MLRILVDEDMPRPTARFLRSLNIDAIDVRDVGLKGATDREVFEYAQANGMIILSRDKGFSNILEYPPEKHHGIIWVNFPNTFIRRQILETIERFFVEVERERLPNHLTILEIGRYRIRKRSFKF